MWNDFLEPVLLSLEVSLTSGIIVIILGMLIGWFMVNKTFKGKVIIETIILLPLVLSPTVIGFLLIVIFGKNSWLGEMIEWFFHRSLLFTWWAAVIASAVVAFPLMYQAAKAGFHEVDKDIEGAALVDGANKFQVFLYISIPLASKMLVAGGIMSFARALGEFGATLMFAGNIPGETQTLPTAIYVAIDSGNMTMAWLWVLTTILISFLMLLVIHVKSE
ncbi:molybdate ABC transporter permease subunit [Priestia megaterium]|uniref:molybdate ABC transporter permease subunit n=1 Tax=Priestia megaterium TaxID=1404 RepID=UPI00272FD2AD|nr:molybdate ABC transporter permease subunit [Priestia megaterium]MDP1442090.1 molybdate ABC transporter permease subunit [Priestia megaterium]MDP1471133.1 molybdate ABC transporter permease subunit [Priestia megaterium]